MNDPSHPIYALGSLGFNTFEMGWDELVHEALLFGCLTEALGGASKPENPPAGLLSKHTAQGDTDPLATLLPGDPARQAKNGWLVIDLCLLKWGELAALALERSIEEARLLVGRESNPDRQGAGLEILMRANQRLDRFWREEAPFAA